MAQVPPPAMTAMDFMGLGLEIGGHDKWRTYKYHTNVKRFKEAYGVIPETCVLIWDALRNSMDAAVRLKKKTSQGIFLWPFDSFGRTNGLAMFVSTALASR
jgi:hypothetical protein